MSERSHRLKTHESVFLEVRLKNKKAEFRKNDRDYMVGDVVYLDRYRPGYYAGRRMSGNDDAYMNKDGMPASGAGKGDLDTIKVRITHLAKGGFGIPDGFCMFSFEILEDPCSNE